MNKKKLHKELSKPLTLVIRNYYVLLIVIALLIALVGFVFYHIGVSDNKQSIANQEHKQQLEQDRAIAMQHSLPFVWEQTAKSVLIVIGQHPVIFLLLLFVAVLVRL